MSNASRNARRQRGIIKVLPAELYGVKDPDAVVATSKDHWWAKRQAKLIANRKKAGM